MLLIIILGLMAKLMSVSGDCDIGNHLVKDFDFNKFSGPRPWYGRTHTSRDVENNFDCAEFTVASPEGNWSLVTAKVYDISKQRHMITYGNATNWNSNGYFDLSHQVSLWNGRVYIVAVEYDRYLVIKICPFGSNEATLHVGYRHSHPDKATVEEVIKVMKDNNIDVSHVVDWKADHCQHA